jgi:hypothetical protein
MQKKRIVLLLAVSAFAAQPAAAEKTGTWVRTTDTRIADPSDALHAMSADIAQKMQVSAGPSTMTYCADETAPLPTEFKPSPALTCTMTDPELNGGTFKTDFVCQGDTHGPGKMTIVYDTPEHYTGKSTYSPQDMMDMKWKSTFEGRWTGPACTKPAP